MTRQCMFGEKRILYLITSSDWGGAERYVAVLAKKAVQLGEVHIIAGPGEGTLFDRVPHEAYVYRSIHLKRRINPICDLLAAWDVRRYVKSNGINLIHANSTKAGFIASLAVRGMRNRPRIIYTAHGWAFLEEDRSWAFRKLTLACERFASRFRDATIVLSEKERRVALEQGLARAHHLHLIPHGIAPGAIAFMTRSDARTRLFGTDAPDFVFGTVANAYPPKALPNLISAFERIALKRPDAKLVIVGDGPTMSALKDQRERSRFKERIFLPGQIVDGARLMNAFDVFALASSKEGMPWVILEASLAGLPIIATRVGAIPEMVRGGESGLLVPARDVATLADAMARVHDDEALRTKLKNGSPRIAKSRPESHMLRKTLKAYWAEA